MNSLARLLFLAALAVGAWLPCRAGEPNKKEETVTFTVATIKNGERDSKGRVPVTISENGSKREGSLPKARWKLLIDGIVDKEGFNLTTIDAQSGLRKMRLKPGNEPDDTDTLAADKGDIITHINGIKISSGPVLVYALNSATDPRDVPIVIKDGNTGKQYIYWVTAKKVFE